MEEFNLKRFLKVQDSCFEIAYYELKNGKKESCWMLYIFPQIFGLGNSDMANYYAINNLSEAKAYLQNETLRERMFLLVEILLNLNISDPVAIFSFPDNLKFWSSMTLFNQADPEEKLFKQALDKFFQGRLDLATINIIKDQEGNNENISN